MNKQEKEELTEILDNLRYTQKDHITEGSRKQIVQTAIDDLEVLLE